MKLVSWNVEWCLGVDGCVDPERLVREARDLADFDVLCLQEVACNFPALKGSAGEDQFARLAAALPGYAAISGVAVDTAAPDGSRRLFGNMILSRLPVRQVARVRLPWAVDPAVRNMPRMLLEATVETPFGLLRVMTTHLEYYSATQLAAQIEALRDHHAEACAHALADRRLDASNGPLHSQPEAISALLCGDFNCKSSDLAYARMTAAFDDHRVMEGVLRLRLRLHRQRPAWAAEDHRRRRAVAGFGPPAGGGRDRLSTGRGSARPQPSDCSPARPAPR